MADAANDRLMDVGARIEALEAQRGEQALVVETKARRDQNTEEAEQVLRDIQATLMLLHAEQAGLLQSEHRDA